MKHKALRHIALAGLAGAVLAACGGGGSGDGPDPQQSAGLLRKVSNAGELESSIKSGLTAIRSNSSLDSTVGGGAGGAPTAIGSYSRTYTQDADVDEFDSVKYDGEYLFIAPTRGQFGCCFIADSPLAGSAPPAEHSIRIFETDPANAGVTATATIPLEDGISVQGLYRSGNRLVAMTSESFYGSYGGPWASLAIWAPGKSGIAVYDTTDIANPSLTFEASFDGIFVESRRVGNTVYVVSRYTPDIPNLHYHVINATQQAENQAILNGLSLDDLLPKITVNGSEQRLVDPAQCYVPSDETPSYPVITSITAIPVDNPASFSTTCYNDDAYGIYVSPTALYAAQSRDEGQGTRLHKFRLAAGAPVYAGSGDVDGIVWTGGQADFRLSERDGFLRVFASQFDNNSADFVDHFLYVLQESATEPALEIVSQLPNANNPNEIGKPNEDLYGVRFLDDRAYAVTFERIDPLYVFDLADPADPRIAGTLEVTGFSELLHPVTDDLLLGLGRSDNNSVKVELFDVSVLSQPLSLGSDVLGGPGSNSEAAWDRHAFTYLADVDGVDRFAFPADLTAMDGSFNLVESALFLYEIRDKDLPNLATMQQVGKVVARDAGSEPNYSSRSRTVLHDDAIFYVRDDELYTTRWTMPDTVDGPH